MRPIRLAHLYADVMNVYGDRGNILALEYRSRARGLELEVLNVAAGTAFEPTDADLLVVGGGQDGEQRRIADDLLKRGQAIRAAVEAGLPCLAVCGGFQLFGQSYVDDSGNELPGIGVFSMETRHPGRRGRRCIGNVVVNTRFGVVVGFENHGGRTFLSPGQRPFGRVRNGFGNNGRDRTEGAITANAIGTYIHGSLLPKNPAVADRLLLNALARRGAAPEGLDPLDDRIEEAARRRAIKLASGRRFWPLPR